jgi:hypothetical protein
MLAEAVAVCDNVPEIVCVLLGVCVLVKEGVWLDVCVAEPVIVVVGVTVTAAGPEAVPDADTPGVVLSVSDGDDATVADGDGDAPNDSLAVLSGVTELDAPSDTDSVGDGVTPAVAVPVSVAAAVIVGLFVFLPRLLALRA